MNLSDSSAAPQKSGPSGPVIVCVSLALLGLLAVILWESGIVHVTASTSSTPGKPTGVTSSLTIVSPNGTTVTGSDPSATLPPKWVPAYPAMQAQDGGTKRETKETIGGSYTARTQDAPDKVKDYFESTLKADGFETSADTGNTDGAEFATITGIYDGGKRKITIKANTEKGHTNLAITYEGAK